MDEYTILTCNKNFAFGKLECTYRPLKRLDVENWWEIIFGQIVDSKEWLCCDRYVCLSYPLNSYYVKVLSESIKHKIYLHLKLNFRIFVAQSEYYNLGLAPHSQELAA